MKYVYFLIVISSFHSCKGQSKYTQKVVHTFTDPEDSLIFQIKAPDSINVFRLHTKYNAIWNDTIINRGAKLSAREYHTTDFCEFHSGTTINYSYYKYKATKYKVRLEYWFEYFDKEKK